MKLIGAGLGDHVDHRAGVASVFGVERIRDDAEFVDRCRASAARCGRFTNMSFASPPLTLKLLARPRPPLTETDAGIVAAVKQIGTAVPNCDCTPGCNCRN